MKRISLLTLLFSLIFIYSCGSNTDKTQTAVTDNTIQTEPVDGKPEFLTYETFKEKVWDFEANPNEWIYKGMEPCIIDFYADWCRPCKMIAPIMEELAAEYKGKVKIYKIDTQKERELAAIFQIRSIPAVLFSPMKGKPMIQTGAMPKESYVKVIEENLLSNNNSQE